VKSLTPAQSLVLLLFAGVAISGWFYGIHWKRVASGDLFSSEEKMMIRLQDQIRSLTETNANLNEQLKAYSEETEVTDGAVPPKIPASALEVPTVTAPVPTRLAPALPSRPQKVESH